MVTRIQGLHRSVRCRLWISDPGWHDATEANRRLFQDTIDDVFLAQADIDGDGRIRINDLFFSLQRQRTELPKGTPVSPLTSLGIRAAILAELDDEATELESVLDDLIE